jgi:riboflavin synthase
MFTGIIKKTSTIESVQKKNGSIFAVVKKDKKWSVELGQSIAINGVCSTVKNFTASSFLVEWMPETIKKTTVEDLSAGSMVNLETSVNLATLLDGHIVQGHIDTIGVVAEIKPVTDSWVVKIKLPASFMKFIANKGSVTINGVSLTVVDTGRDWFTVALVSYTIEHTNFHKMKKGDRVNIETDVLAKYVYKLMKK